VKKPDEKVFHHFENTVSYEEGSSFFHLHSPLLNLCCEVMFEGYGVCYHFFHSNLHWQEKELIKDEV
jgi:hypothetical protein